MTASRRAAPTRRWCAYMLGELESSGMLAFGWAIDSRGAVRGVHRPAEYLVEPERGGEAVWRPAQHIDFEPPRQERCDHERPKRRRHRRHKGT